ncbi:oxoglutarate/iron-dependent dioxygenase, Isopenicillin N synthase-like protein [Artemisia annua]|uniref:Oxoglutarate/iron-dependent dioxygenase, Isopenicillin N synthase-like protein n=1 Tax=Artemisia annua TaxID=35608 RepID=A0A2U1LCM2_ARTAN|nr:oxoglutarate/iron-dependent dioxygenase, Isopenicillin N synthase-like protein [Artemisia annua]
MVFLFPKKLQKSDVNNVGRIVLPKQPAETHLPRLLDDESMILPVIDMDGADVLSNGRLHTPFHRVVMNANKTRLSVGLFSMPKVGSIVKPPKE